MSDYHNSTPREASQEAPTSPDTSFLTTVHISPLDSGSGGFLPETAQEDPEEAQLTIWPDGSLIEIRTQEPSEIPSQRNSPPIRGNVSGFSRKSRRRLQQMTAKVRRDKLPIVVHLTFPAEFPSPNDAKTYFDTFFKRVARKFPTAGLIWKLEPQQRGAPHFHLLVWGVNYWIFRAWSKRAWFDVVGSGDPNHLDRGAWTEKVKNKRQLVSYIAKYMGKNVTQQEGWELPGRFWGVRAGENIPWSATITIGLTLREGFRVLRELREMIGMEDWFPRNLFAFHDNPDKWAGELPFILGWQ